MTVTITSPTGAAMECADWIRAEIARKRDQAKLLMAEANGMQEVLAKWEDSQRGATASSPTPRANGHAKPRRRKTDTRSRTAFVMAKIAEGTGVTNDDLFNSLVADGREMKRASLRATLWHAKMDGQIVSRDGKWFPAEKGPDA